MNIEVYRREDGKWAWRMKAGNNKILANDAGQGYENKADAVAYATMVTGFGTRLYESITLSVEGDEPLQAPILKPEYPPVAYLSPEDRAILQEIADTRIEIERPPSDEIVEKIRDYVGGYNDWVSTQVRRILNGEEPEA